MNPENFKTNAGQLAEPYTGFKTISSTQFLVYSWVLLAKVAAFANFSFAYWMLIGKSSTLAIKNEDMSSKIQQCYDITQRWLF